MAKFTVDTHLFRELGELLVGRDSTALVELVKNAYDADASEVVVYGQDLEDLGNGVIRIVDTGTGMTPDQFERGFLRIASRTKELGNRLSTHYQRRFTGAKGIGRLAAHKLARRVNIASVSVVRDEAGLQKSVNATIDWDAVERWETLDQLDGTDAILVESSRAPATTSSGTVITLSRLRRRWTVAERGRFLREVQTFEPPPILTAPLPQRALSKPLLFEQPLVRESSTDDPGFQVILEGDFATGEDYWQALVEAADWVIEIDARRGSSKVRYAIAPTRASLASNPSLEPRWYDLAHPSPQAGPFFQSRILVRDGPISGPRAAQDWVRRAAGIRIFLEGFRVLPYGESNNDWLSLDSDYARRSRSTSLLGAEEFPDPSVDKDAGLSILPNRSYFGAVFLTEDGARSLRMLVNREGFVPEEGYDTLIRLVRLGVDLSVRVRAAASLPERHDRRERREAEARMVQPAGPAQVSIAMARATSLVGAARHLLSTGDVSKAVETVAHAVAEVEGVARASDEMIAERSMLRILASVGTQMAAFIHEIRGLLSMAQAIEGTLTRIRISSELPSALRGDLAQLQSAIGDLRRSIERQASYLVDVVTPDARRRRSRQSLSERFDAGYRLVQSQAERLLIKVRNEIPSDLKSPPMFPAELTTIFANLLTNAVKAAGQSGCIRAWAQHQPDGTMRLLVENTGEQVNPAEGERWFRPFESTTVAVDSVLGQGMGLGLTITRNLLEEYGATIRFAQPSVGFATALEITFPG